jgi:hypothetical protein
LLAGGQAESPQFNPGSRQLFLELRIGIDQGEESSLVLQTG